MPYKDSENLRISEWLPAVIEFPVERTSPAEGYYNCFAYVAGDYDRKWGALAIRPAGVYWPTKVTPDQEKTIGPYLEGYGTLGFELCDNGSFEDGLEKIVIFVDDLNEPQHAAIQRQGGVWQSKLGPDIDVVHALESFASSERYLGKGYGYPKYFMARMRQKSPVLR